MFIDQPFLTRARLRTFHAISFKACSGALFAERPAERKEGVGARTKSGQGELLLFNR